MMVYTCMSPCVRWCNGGRLVCGNYGVRPEYVIVWGNEQYWTGRMEMSTDARFKRTCECAYEAECMHVT